MAELFVNNASSTLTSAVNSTAETFTLADASKFPTPTGGDFCRITLVGYDEEGAEISWEICHLTARSGNTLTVTRAQDGTTAAAWASGATVEARLTAAAVAALANTVTSVAGRTGDVTLAVADVSGAVASDDSRLTDSREWTGETVAQAEAEAGIATTRRAWTAQRVFQAIAAWWAASSAKTKLDGIESGAQVNTVGSVAGKTGAVTLETADVSGAVDTTDARLSDSREWSAATVSQVDAEAGTGTTRVAWTVQRVWQAIAAYISANVASIRAVLSLQNVDNTSDLNKPISTATQTALNAKADAAALAEKQDTLVSGTNIKTVNGTSLLGGGDVSISGDFSNVVVLTGSGNWAVPSNVEKVKVTLVGGGGAGGGGTTSGFGGGGGGGGASIGILAVTPSGTVSYSVGAGGTGSTGAGTAGGTTSFGVISATGGGGGGVAGGFTIASGGIGSGGSINLSGENGYTSYSSAAELALHSKGGSSLLGFGGAAHGNPGQGYGAGGGGAYRTTTNRSGGGGTAGVIIVEY